MTTLPETPEPLVRLAAAGVAAALMVMVLPLTVKTSPSANLVVAAVVSAAGGAFDQGAGGDRGRAWPGCR